MANEKTLNTRIVLKHDTLAKWQSSDYNKTSYLKEGEIAIVTLGNVVDGSGEKANHPVLFKVGTGEHLFDELPFASALAADVYAWAKASDVVLEGKTIKFVGSNKTINIPFITESEANNLISAALANYSTTAQMEAAIEVETNRALAAEEAISERIDAFNLPEGGFASKSEFDELKGKVEDEDGAMAKANSAYELAESKVSTSDFNTFKTENTAAIGTAKSEAIAAAAEDATTKANAAQAAAEATAAADATSKANKALEDAKEYADANDANETFTISYTDKTITLTGSNGTNSSIPADDFIKDGMIESVAISEDGKNLVITWNTDAGKEATTIALSELADIYTGVDGTTVKVDVSADDKISAEVKTNSLTDGHIASNAAIAKSKLANDVQESLNKADTAIQSLDGYATETYADGVAATAKSEAIAAIPKNIGAFTNDAKYISTLDTNLEIDNESMSLKSGYVTIDGAAGLDLQSSGESVFITPAEGYNVVVYSELNMSNHKIINLDTPIENTDAANKKYVDDRDAAILEVAKQYADNNDADTTYTAKADGGLKLDGTEFSIDDSFTFVFDCGTSDSNYNALA